MSQLARWQGKIKREKPEKLCALSVQVKGSVNAPKGFLTSLGMTKGGEKHFG